MRCCGCPLALAGRLAGVSDPDILAHEAGLWWGLVWPLGLTAAFRLSLVVIDQAFVGHLGTAELAGAALAGVWIDVVSGWMWPSFGTAVSTLSSQAIGAKHESLAGVWLQTGLALGLGAAVPVVGALLASRPMFGGLGFPEREADLAGTFAAWYSPGIVAGFPFVILLAFLKAQAVVIEPMVVCGVMVLANVALNAFLIHGTTWFQPAGEEAVWAGLGFVGSPLATSITRWLTLLGLLLYLWRARSREGSTLRRTWVGCQCSRALSGRRLWQMAFGFAVPLALANMLEELQLQVVAFLAAELGQAELAAHTSMLTLFFFCSSAMYSAVDATATRIGRHLGAGDIPRAKLVMYIDAFFSLGCAALVGSVLAAAGGNLARLFSDDPAVIDAVRPLAVLVGCCYAFLCAFFVSVAVLDAMGRTSAVATSFVTGAWLVAVPLAFVLDRVLHLGLNGLWYGLCVGYTVVTIIAVAFVIRSDWHDASRRAIERARRHSVDEEPPTRAAPLAGQFLTTRKQAGVVTDTGVTAPLLDSESRPPVFVGPSSGSLQGGTGHP